MENCKGKPMDIISITLVKKTDVTCKDGEIRMKRKYGKFDRKVIKLNINKNK